MNRKEFGPAGALEGTAGQFSGHEASVVRYYAEWEEFYRRVGGFHIQLFEPGQAPDELGVPLSAIAEFRAAGFRRLTDVVTEPAGISCEDHVLDAGCGFGAVAMQLARKHSCRVTGVNIVLHQLEQARELAEQAGLAPGVDFKWADCSRALPFDDSSVDVVVCMEAACHFSDRSRFLHEVGRILRPGGRLAVEDFMIPDEFTDEDCREYVEPFCRAWSLHSLESRGSYARKLEAAGLELVEFTGFDGADAYNLRVAEIHHRSSALRLLGGDADPGLMGWHRAWATLAQAWRQEHISPKRLLARA